MSLSAEQVEWLAQVMLALQRGADVRVLMRGKLAASTLRTIVRAKVRAASVPPPPGPKARATHCRNGHAFTGANTYTDPTGTRRCRICVKAGEERYRAKKSQANALGVLRKENVA